MKKVTTNMTFGQILFVLSILFASSLMFFYFGAKFGGDILALSGDGDKNVADDEPFLPDDRVSREIRDIIASHEQKLDFHAAVSDAGVIPTVAAKKDDAKAPVLKVGSSGALPQPVAAEPEKPAEVAVKPAPEVVVVPVQKIEIKSIPTPQSTVIQKTASKDSAQKVFMPGDLPAIPFSDAADVKPPSPSQAKGIPPVAKPAPKPVVVAKKPQEEKLRVLMPSAPVKPAAVVVEPVASTSVAPQESVAVRKNYRLQVGSFAQKSSALASKAEWEKRGYAVRLVETSVPGKGTWYRLNIGGYDSLAAVQDAQRKIMTRYRQTAMVLGE